MFIYINGNIDCDHFIIDLTLRPLCKIISPMKTILLLTDFSAKSEKAAEYAYQLAANTNASVVLFNSYFVPQGSVFAGVYTSEYNDFSSFEEESMAKLQLQAKKVKDKFEYGEFKNGPTIECKNQIGNLSENVKDYLKKNEVWMIMMGTKRTDGFLNHFLFGSETEMIVESANCPVLLISDQTEYHDLNKIVFASAAFDEEDFKALNYIADLATPYKSTIIITHIDPVKKKEEEKVEIPKEIYLSWSEMKYKNVTFHDIKSDDITESIKKFAQIEAIDVITLIYRKHTFFDQLFKENTIRKMLDYEKVPLLVFPKDYFEKD